MGGGFVQDLRFAIRSLRGNRGFACAAIAALALGIGANTAIFSVVDTVMFRPLPYPNSSRLVQFWVTRHSPDGNRSAGPKARRSEWVSNRDFERWAERNRSFELVAGWRVFFLTATGHGEPERLRGGAVTPEFFRLFGARTILGRTFVAREDRPGDDRVVVLSYGLWQRRFGSDPGVVGQTLHIDAVPHTVIGVLEPGFRPVLPEFPARPECYVTMSHTLQGERAKFTIFFAGGRLRPGVTLAQAQADMAAVAAGLEKETPRFNAGKGVELASLAEGISGNVRPAMVVLLGAVGCVLLVCCANVANLLLARATARQREISVRAVLGAGRGRLLRQLLTESVLLAAAGGLAGMLLAHWGVRLLAAAMPPETLPRAEDVAMDLRVLGFGFALSLLTGLLFGIVPAIVATERSARSLAQTMKELGGAVAGGRERWWRNAIVVVEVSLALVLLTGAGLLIRSFLSLRAVDLGFRAKRVLTAGVTLPDIKYPGRQQRAEFIDRLLEGVHRIPGVESAAVTNSIPISFGPVVGWSDFEISGVTEDAEAGLRTVTRDYFRIMGIPLRRGRLFSRADAKGGAVIVNQAFVRRYWPREPADSPEPLGRRLKWNDSSREIVGVVGDIRFWGRKSEAEAEMYVPHTENDFSALVLVLRTSEPQSRVMPALRSAVSSVDPGLPLERVATMDEAIGRELATPRFHMLLLVSFAALALALAAVGIYGVIGYSVARRRREIGIRMALGASSSTVLRSVLREASLLAVAGVLAGVAAAIAATRVLATLLFGVAPVDPLTFAAVGALLLLVALLAAWVPARRATRVDPMTVLRYE